MPKHQEAWCDLITDNEDLVCLAPANHGKTTVFSIINATHEVTKNRSIRIGLVCNTDSLAESILSEIKWHLENNDKLTETYGKFRPEKIDKWSKWQIQVTNDIATLRKKDATISAFGAMSAIKGIRFDMVLGDDIVDEKNSKTREKCDALWDWLWSTLIPRCEPNAPKKFMGTVENERDIYHRFIENPRGFKVIRQQAIIDENKRQVLWPERLPYAYLARMREANYSSFMKTYQNVIVGSEVAKIGQDKIDACYDASRKFFPHHIPNEERQKYKYILTGVDPAWTKKRRSKYSVILTAGITHDDERVILDVFRDKVEYDHLFKWIKNKYHSLLPQYVLVESNQMQARLTQELQNAAIPTKALYTSEAKNDIDTGIPMLYSVISAGKLRLPTGDPASAALSGQLINEILSYPNGQYSDVLMALYFVEQEVRKRTLTAHAVQKSVVNGKNYNGTRFSRRYQTLWH